MSTQMKRGLTGTAIVGAVLIMVGAVWLSLPSGESAEPIREIVLDARLFGTSSEGILRAYEIPLGVRLRETALPPLGRACETRA